MNEQCVANYFFQIEVTTVCKEHCPAAMPLFNKADNAIFNVDGRSLPCPFIKDAADFLSDKNLLKEFAASSVPGICEGCREIGDARQ